MTTRGSWLPLCLMTALIAVAGCADCTVRYEPNAALHAAPRLDKTLAVVGFADRRPSWEIVNDFGYATSDLKCDDIVRTAIGRSVMQDVAKSGIFRETVYLESGQGAERFDLALNGEIRHFCAQYQQRWLTPAAFPFIFILAPFYIPGEYASSHIEIRLVLTDAKTTEPIWVGTVAREWTYGPMTAFSFLRGDSLLYGILRDRLRTSMAAAIRNMDMELSARLKDNPCTEAPSPSAE